MIELAPHHKSGLPVANPILLAGGTIGYGEARHAGLVTERLGGVVVGPILLNSRGGETGARLAELNGGFVLETGRQNRGLNAVLRQFAALWSRLGCPVIAQLADDQPEALGKVATRLAEVDGLSGLELAVPPTANADLVRQLVRAATRINDLPVWVKLPLTQAIILAPVAVEAGAVGLVVGQPPLGSAMRRRSVISKAVKSETVKSETVKSETVKSGTAVTDPLITDPLITDPLITDPLMTGPLVTGPLYGPLTFASMLNALNAVARLDLPCALIACGGIYTADQVHQALAVGAHAVQIDAAVWVEPGLPVRLAEACQAV